MFRLTLSFALGIFLISYGSSLILITTIALLVLVIGRLPGCYKKIGAAFVLGLLFATWVHTAIQSSRVAAERGLFTCVEFRIMGRPTVTERYQSFYAELTRSCDEGHLGNVSLPITAKVYWYGYEGLTLSDRQRWRARLSLKPSRGLENFKGFDQTQSWYRKGVMATASVKAKPIPVLIDEPSPNYRSRLSRRLRTLSQGMASSSLFPALVLGERDAITNEQWDVFRRTGTSHLMAISGLHVGIVLGVVYWGVGFLWRRIVFLCLWCPASKVSALASLIAISGYCDLANWSLPTTRAFIMSACFLVFPLFGFHVSIWRRWSLALLIVLITDPLSVLAPGVYLSFGAVASILLFAQRSKDWSPWARLLGVHVFLSIALFPVTLLWFGESSLISPFANLVAIPASTLLIPLLLLATLVSCLWAGAGVVMLSWVSVGFDLLERCLGWMSHGSWVLWPSSDRWFSVVALGLVLGFLYRHTQAYQRWKRVFLITLLIPLLWSSASTKVRVLIFDVGQGLAVLIRTPAHTYLYDTGAGGKYHGDKALQVIVPHLQSEGIKQIKQVIISHSDIDHAGGLPTIMSSMAVGSLVSGTPEFLSFEASECPKGTFKDGLLIMHWLPTGNKEQKKNNRSCVLKLMMGQLSILIPGDIEAFQEGQLIDSSADQLASDVLIAPHHGSKTSSSRAFLEAVKPGYVVYSSGFLNHHGHPALPVVKRYDALKIVQLNTAIDGAVLFEADEQHWQVHTFAQQHSEFWRY